jgi:aminoglycoside 6'-N-acetyltransferase I
MLIRSVAPADRAEWLRMRRGLWPAAPGEPDDHPAEIDAWLADASPEGVVLVADRGDGRLAGFLELSLRPWAEGCASHPVPYVEGWWVDADVRRRHVGAALVHAAEAWSRERGFTEMASDVLLDNDASHAAHRALGFEEVERVVTYRKSLVLARNENSGTRR